MVFLGIMAPFFAFAALMLWFGTHHTKVRHRQKLEEMQQLEKLRIAAKAEQIDNGLLAQQNSRIELLEDRMQVLERIVTDRGVNVAAQIEALRDSNSIDELNRERTNQSR